MRVSVEHPTDRRFAQLAERLRFEYVGAVSPGRVRQVVAQSGHALRQMTPDPDTLHALVEQAARRTLVREIAGALADRELGDVSVRSSTPVGGHAS